MIQTLLLVVIIFILLFVSRPVKCEKLNVPTNFALPLTETMRSRFKLDNNVIAYNPMNKHTIRMIDSGYNYNQGMLISEAIFDSKGVIVPRTETGLLPVSSDKLHVYADFSTKPPKIKLGLNDYMKKYFPEKQRGFVLIVEK